jgi:protein SCO1/2
MRASQALGVAGALCALVLTSCWKDPELPVLGTVPEFQLLDQNARPLHRDSLRGSVWVANFMFTKCPDVCPMLTTRMAHLRTALAKERGKVRFVSLSVDPEHDDPATLKRYAAEHGADRPDWSFATGPGDELQRVIVSGFKQTLQPMPATAGKERTILHGSHFVLVDAALQLRGFYPTDAEGLARLARDARLLLARR